MPITSNVWKRQHSSQSRYPWPWRGKGGLALFGAICGPSARRAGLQRRAPASVRAAVPCLFLLCALLWHVWCSLTAPHSNAFTSEFSVRAHTHTPRPLSVHSFQHHGACQLFPRADGCNKLLNMFSSIQLYDVYSFCHNVLATCSK